MSKASVPVPPLRCPECPDGHLVERRQKATGHRFLGCDRWPKCDHTQEVPAYVHMLRQGAKPLPGME